MIKTLHDQEGRQVLPLDKSIVDALGIDSETPLQLTVTGNTLVVKPDDSGHKGPPPHAQESPAYQRSQDPLFSDLVVFSGDTPADLAERHDDYLYGDMEP